MMKRSTRSEPYGKISALERQNDSLMHFYLDQTAELVRKSLQYLPNSSIFESSAVLEIKSIVSESSVIDSNRDRCNFSVENQVEESVEKDEGLFGENDKHRNTQPFIKASSIAKNSEEIINSKKNSIIDIHKLYLNKKENRLRAELYITLKGYFKKHNLEEVKKFAPTMNKEVFNLLMLPPSKGINKVDNFKSKMQQTVDFLLKEYENNNKYIQQLCCGMELKQKVEKMKSLEWNCVQMNQKSADTNYSNLSQFTLAVRRSVKEQLKSMVTGTVIVMSNMADEFGYISLKVQKNTRKQIAVVFAFRLNYSNLFYNGFANNNIINMVAQQIGFRSWRFSILKAKNLQLLYETCNEKPKTLNIKNKLKKCQEKEKQLNDRGISVYPPRTYNDAVFAKFFKSEGDQNVDTMHSEIQLVVNKRKGNNTEQIRCPVKVTLNLRGVNMDEYMAELYRQGLFSKPNEYIAMRKKKSNLFKTK